MCAGGLFTFTLKSSQWKRDIKGYDLGLGGVEFIIGGESQPRELRGGSQLAVSWPVPRNQASREQSSFAQRPFGAS